MPNLTQEFPAESSLGPLDSTLVGTGLSYFGHQCNPLYMQVITAPVTHRVRIPYLAHRASSYN